MYLFYLFTPVLRRSRPSSRIMYNEFRSMRPSLHIQAIVQYSRHRFDLCVICFIKTCTYLRIEPTRLQRSIEHSIKQLIFNHLSVNFLVFRFCYRSLQAQIRHTPKKFPSNSVLYNITSLVLKIEKYYRTIEKCSNVMLSAV